MIASFYIVEGKPASSDKTFVGEVDGGNAMNVSDFLKEIAEAFRFPDYFGYNYNALDECINDLSWIDFPNYILYIKNYDHFLKNEDDRTKLDTLTLFQNACSQWAGVPNFEGEGEFRKKANFNIYVEKCKEAEIDLKALSYDR